MKLSNPEFDITMGCDDGAESSEMIGLFLLNKINTIIPKEDLGLYRDDGLGVIPDNGPNTARIIKKLHKFFKNYNLSIQVEAGMKTTDFLDVILDLKTGKTMPFRKENDTPIYINTESNHPPSVVKQLPSMIENRLSNLSSGEKEFNDSKEIYQKALNDAGYTEKIKYKQEKEKVTSNQVLKRKRKRKIMWFTPPFSKEVKSNITKLFIQILERCFPQGNTLRKIFNKNTIKISYSTTKNISKIISAHNRKILQTQNNVQEPCRCRGGLKNCPVEGKCLLEGVIYQAEVKSREEGTKIYIGGAATKFRLRYNNHTKSFKNKEYINDTELSKYIWKLKDNNINYDIKWKVISKASPYNPQSEKCDLCLTEKAMIATYKNKSILLNTRKEMMSKCRHRDKWLLSNWKKRKRP